MNEARLSTALKSYPHTEALISGDISDPRIRLDYVQVEPIHRAFAPMARTQSYDVCEMAIVTYLQAKAYNKPLLMLPAVVAARFQEGCIVYNAQRGAMSVKDLVGARVGVRAYTQTTGVWVRGILAETYGIPNESVNWISFEGGHLEEYKEPSFVSRAPEGTKMLSMLMEGQLDAAIFGNDLPKNPGIMPLIPYAKKAGEAWYAKHKFVPVNHIVVMNRKVVDQNPQSAGAVYELLKRGQASVQTNEPDRFPFGIEALRHPLEVTLDYCDSQQLLPRKLTVNEILDECLEVMGEGCR